MERTLTSSSFIESISADPQHFDLLYQAIQSAPSQILPNSFSEPSPLSNNTQGSNSGNDKKKREDLDNPLLPDLENPPSHLKNICTSNLCHTLTVFVGSGVVY